MGKTFTIEADYKPILSGEIVLPNAMDVDPLLFLNNLASGGHSLTPHWGWAMLPDNSRRQWTQFFLTPAGMGGRLDGGGYAVTYGGKAPIVRRFAICKHEKADGLGANHSYGWHPGSCKLCGLDMSIDSSG